MPRIKEWNRREHFDPAVMREFGRAGLPRREPRRLRLRRHRLRGLRAHHARAGARRHRLPLGVQRPEHALHDADLRLRQRGAAAEIPAAHGEGGVARLLRPDRARPRLGPRQHEIAREKRRRAATVLTGTKLWITHAPIADIMVVWAKDEGGRHPRLHPRARDEGTGDAQDRGQVLGARFTDRRSRDGRGLRAGGEPAAERLGPESALRLPQQRALRHLLGRARRRRVLLAYRPPATRWSASSSAARSRPISWCRRSSPTCRPRSRSGCSRACT